MLPNVIMQHIFCFVPNSLQNLWNDARNNHNITLRDKCVQWKHKDNCFDIDKEIKPLLHQCNYNELNYLLSIAKPSLQTLHDLVFAEHHSCFVLLLYEHHYLNQIDLRRIFSVAVRRDVYRFLPDCVYLDWFMQTLGLCVEDVKQPEDLIPTACFVDYPSIMMLEWLIKRKFPIPDASKWQQYFLNAAKQENMEFMNWCLGHGFAPSFLSSKQVGIFKRSKKNITLKWLKDNRVKIVKNIRT